MLSRIEALKVAPKRPPSHLLFSAVMALGPVSTVLYLPALPTIAHSLQTSEATIALTVGAYLFGFSFGQLIWGPLGDKYGRRAPLLMGLMIFLVASLGCCLATSPAQLIICRVFQAAGSCAGVVLARAMVRDLYEAQTAARVLSSLITITSIGPLIGPFIGGQLLLFASWRVIFWILAGIALLLIFAIARSDETLPIAKRSPGSLTKAFSGYVDIARRKRVVLNGAIGGCFYIGIYAQVSGTPFVYMQLYHVPQHWYGILFGASIVGIMAMNVLNIRLLRSSSSESLVQIGTVGAAVASIAVAFFASTRIGGLWGVVTPILLYCSMSGLIIANSMSSALSEDRSRAGTISAFTGALQFALGIVGSVAISVFADGSAAPLGFIMAAAGMSCLVLARLLKRA